LFTYCPKILKLNNQLVQFIVLYYEILWSMVIIMFLRTGCQDSFAKVFVCKSYTHRKCFPAFFVKSIGLCQIFQLSTDLKEICRIYSPKGCYSLDNWYEIKEGKEGGKCESSIAFLYEQLVTNYRLLTYFC